MQKCMYLDHITYGSNILRLLTIPVDSGTSLSITVITLLTRIQFPAGAEIFFVVFISMYIPALRLVHPCIQWVHYFVGNKAVEA